jgi:hypothetical protein
LKHLIYILVLVLVLGSMVPMSLVLALPPPGLTTTDLGLGLTKEDLVKKLLGPGIEIQNVSYTGVNASAGTFSGGTGIIGFDEGIVLSSGHISNVVGPNKAGNTNTILDLSGDNDLGNLAGYPTYDAVILEFDFKPAGKTITFDYVFGSEEYNEYVGSLYNDVFGFFLSGPDISKTNIALLPGGNTPVAINNINKGQNSAYFRDNDYDDFKPGPCPVDTELDGLTTVLSVNVEVTPGYLYHIKLGIADAGDHLLDSDVFIKAGSFVSIPDLYLEPNEATNKIGALHTLTATYTLNNQPVPGVWVHFEVNSGPHIGTNGDAVTNASGIATWSYTGTSAGTDTIKASLVGDQKVVSNPVTKIWQENGTPPTIEVGGDIDQVSKVALMTPWIVSAIILAAGTAILMWRRRTQS